MPHKIAVVFGTRPAAIKMAPVYLELARRQDDFAPQIWATAQHREMLDQVMETFGLTADRDFNLMRPGQSLTDVTCAVLKAMEGPLAEDPPDCILTQGDTTTAFTAALAAFYAKIPVGHVEAGLRTPTRYSPFPEEMNRRIATRLADFHFAPTGWSQGNLLGEGIPEDRVWVTGNTVIDALDLAVGKTRKNRPALPEDYPLDRLEADRRMVLITGHRRENFGEGFESLCRAIAELARRFSDCEFVYPVHLNPNVREPVYRILSGLENIHLIEPLEYLPFIWSMDRCHFLLSDSGGIQEEAPHLGKPVLVMRESTERPEAIEAGTAKLVGVDYETIVEESSTLMTDEAAYAIMSQAKNPYGDGHAAERIADALSQVLAG